MAHSREWLNPPSSSSATYTPLPSDDSQGGMSKKPSGVLLPGHADDSKDPDVVQDTFVVAASSNEDVLIGRLSLYERKSLLVNAEVDRMGLGRYQLCIWVLCGFGMCPLNPESCGGSAYSPSWSSSARLHA